jgi:C7-cyclitol 7-kinase
MPSLPALAFDLGGTHLRSALIRESGALSHFCKQRIQSVADGLKENEIWDSLIASMLDYECSSRNFLRSSDPIIAAFPGPVAEGRRLMQAPTVAGKAMHIRDIPAELHQNTGRQVYLLNDVSAAAWHLGATTDVSRFIVVTVSSGIGSKIFDRFHPLRVLDEPAYAGEIGHVVVDDGPDAMVCDCGGRGHLGAIASGRGIERSARLAALRSPGQFASSLVHTVFEGSAQSLTNERHVVPAALSGDEWALQIIRDCTRPLARTLLTTVMAAGLERIFVIGGFAQCMGLTYLRMLRDLIIEMSQYAVLGDGVYSLVELLNPGEEACLAGCGAFLKHISLDLR